MTRHVKLAQRQWSLLKRVRPGTREVSVQKVIGKVCITPFVTLYYYYIILLILLLAVCRKKNHGVVKFL